MRPTSALRSRRAVLPWHASGCPRALGMGLALCGLIACFSSGASVRADAFASIPAGDPIYHQLAQLDTNNAKSHPATNGLTRYEAALQVARVATSVGPDSRLPRSTWKALHDVAITLKVELRQLGLDVDATIALCDAKLTIVRPDTTPNDSSRDLIVGNANNRSSLSGNSLLPLPANANIPASGSALASSPNALSNSRTTGTSSLNWRLTPKISAGSSLVSRNAAPIGSAAAPGSAQAMEVARNNSVNYDLNQWLTFRASSAQSRVGLPNSSTTLSAPMFDGAHEARGVGGGVDFHLGDSVRFSTDMEKLSTDTGARGTRLGGGVSLSTFRNRLSVSANVSRLVPDATSTLPSTAAEVGASVGVTGNLSLNLFYQGLFSPQANNNAARIGGGASLSF